MEENKKVALITGGTRGIGHAIVIKFVREGISVAFNYYHSEDQKDRLIKEISKLGGEVLAIKADISKFSEVKKMFREVYDHFGKFDILVNNAGITRDKYLMSMNEEDWDEVINVNLKGTFNMTKASIVTFMKQKSGVIINITSVTGIHGMSGQTNYGASKAGIIGFTKSLAKEVSKLGIRVNAIAPGFIETDMIKRLPEKVKNEQLRQIPLGRFGTPEEVAEMVYFLASDAARYITGQVITIDGGLTI